MPPLPPGNPNLGGMIPDPNMLLQYEMLHMLQTMHQQRRPRDDSDSSSTELWEQSGSKLKAILRLRRRVRKNPIRIAARYRNRSLAKLGVTILSNGTLSSPFTHRMTSERLRLAFGKMSGLRKTRHGVSEILELLEHQQVEQAAATAVQLLKDIHQAALDQESWFLASTLLPWEDPLQREVFGGDEEEMLAAAAWNRSIRDLQAQVSKLTGSQSQTTEQASEETGGRQADKKARGAAKAKAALATAGKGAEGAR